MGGYALIKSGSYVTDLSKISESIGYGGSIYSITSDDNFIYVGGFNTQKVWKLTKVVYIKTLN